MYTAQAWHNEVHISSDVLSLKYSGEQKVIEVIHNFTIPQTADEIEQLMNRNLKRT